MTSTIDAPDGPRLIIVSGPAVGEVFFLTPEEVVLGRDTANGVGIADPSLSRRHCAIAREAAGWVVRDLGSFNGTFVNGERISERILIHADRLRLGATELLFHAERTAPGVAPAPTLPITTSLRLEDALYLRPAVDLPDHARTQRDLLALVHIGTAISGIRERRRLESELLDAAFTVTPASEASFIRIDPVTTGRLVAGTRTRDGHPALPPSDTVVGVVLDRSEAILANAAADQQEFGAAPSVAGRGISSVLAVPVFDGEWLAGLLYLITSDPRVTFDRLHLELLTAIASIGSVAVKNVSRLEDLLAETEKLKQDLRITHKMVGAGEAMQRVYRFIERVSHADSTVLLTGESGTGKELVARALHDNSGRASRPFLAINCAALTEGLLESELFGHERGAFSNAIATKPGKLEVADRGTVFLDEIGELSPALQAKLLRVLQFHEFDRVGGIRPIKVDIRVISATNRDLEKEVAEGRFRQDLLFRLKVLQLHMPPLRERRQDIPALAEHLLELISRRVRRAPARFSPAAIRRLIAYDWPGNVRELENAIERAIVLSTGPEIAPDDLPEVLAESAVSEATGESRFHAAVADVKRRVVLQAIDEANGRLTDAARLLGLHPNYLHRLLRNLKLRD